MRLLSWWVRGPRALSIAPPPPSPLRQPPSRGRSSCTSPAQRQTTAIHQQMATWPLQTAMEAEQRQHHRVEVAATHAAAAQAGHQGVGAAGTSKLSERHCSCWSETAVCQTSYNSMRAPRQNREEMVAAAGAASKGRVRLPSRALKQEAHRSTSWRALQLRRPPASARPRGTMPRYGRRRHV